MIVYCLNPEEPLFLYKNGIVLSRNLFVVNTRLYLCTIGTNSSRYTGHSYRVGGATCAAASGMADWEICITYVMVVTKMAEGLSLHFHNK